MAICTLTTAGEVIDALGGTAETARKTNRQMQAVSNWRKSGRLPAETFLIVSDELAKLGRAAPPELWGIASAQDSAPQVAAAQS
jgi:hypothetical protein